MLGRTILSTGNLLMLLLPIGLGAQTGEEAIEPLVASDPVFFADAGYLGNSAALPVGSYTQADLAVKGAANNSISSVRVQPGFKVEAFDSSDLTGTPLIISGDTPSLAARAFDNRISSVRIVKITAGATFYELCGKGGYNVTLPTGNYTKATLATWGIKDNNVSGVAPGPGIEAELFDGISFTGDSYLANVANLCLSGFDNVTSSIRIRSSAVRFSDNFNDGALDKWGAPLSGDWRIENGALVGTGWGGSIDAWDYLKGKPNYNGDIVVDVDLNMIDGNAEIVFHSTGHWVNEYRIEIWSKDSPDYTNRFQIGRYRNGNYEALTPDGGNTPSPIPIPSRCHATVRRLGKQINVYINGRRIGSIVDSNPLPATGTTGLGVIWDNTGAFDNYQVRR